MSEVDSARGRFFEDFEIGQVYRTGARTITATDIVNFACLSGDFNDAHSNHEYCKTTPFGEPIAHAPLVYSVMAGLHYASGINQGTLVAALGVDKWRFLKPVRAGDTLTSVSTVIGKRETRDQSRGIVVFSREFVNQHGDVVQSLEATILYRRRADISGEEAKT